MNLFQTIKSKLPKAPPAPKHCNICHQNIPWKQLTHECTGLFSADRKCAKCTPEEKKNCIMCGHQLTN